MTPIATRLHKLEAIAGEPLAPAAHHYVIGDDLIAAFGRDDVQKSVLAMIEAGIARLPFPELVVEFSVTPEIRRFVALAERPDATIAATAAALGRRDLFALVAKTPATVRLTAAGLAIDGAANDADAAAVALAASFALLMLNVGGIEKRRVQPTALNRARAQAGKAPVRDHTVLRIGVVYDRAGRALSGAAALRRVYLRAGHVRNQASGRGWADHKPVYIAPQLVNYAPGDDEPAPRARKVLLG